MARHLKTADDLFSGPQGIAGGSLQEGNHVLVFRHDVIEKIFPEWARCFWVVRRRRDVGQHICLCMCLEIAGAQVNRSIVTVEQPLFSPPVKIENSKFTP